MKITSTLKSLLLAATLTSVASIAHADLEEKSEKMCGKIKTCGMQEMQAKGMPEDMLEQMSGMFDSMCEDQLKPYLKSANDAGLEKKANSCIDSMLNESCDNLISERGEFKSEECDKFEQAAKEAGIESDSEKES